MTQRVYNFSAGPAVLPEPVLRRAQDELLALPSAGASVMEISHRSSQFQQILDEAESVLRQLLQLPDDYRVLFLQGGSRLQFSMVPINLLRGTGKSADYILTGSWGKNAYKEAVKEGDVRIAWDGAETNYDRVPGPGEWELKSDAAYVHYTSNETIGGVQFRYVPETGEVPLVCDASSDFCSRPVPVDKFGLIYACAQKNIGPAGVTVVVIRDDLLARCDENLPGMLSYDNLAQGKSCYNTPPTFAIYMVMLVGHWLRDEIGGLDEMNRRNEAKARLLYDVVDGSDGFYRGHARPEDRSLMNVTFRLPSEELEQKFLRSASERQLESLGGHRSVGGIRASIYNAMPLAGVEALAQFMNDFRRDNGG